MKRIMIALCVILLGAAGSFAGPIYNPATGSWYDLTPFAGSWHAVNNYAVASSYLGIPGRLVDIHSADENAWLVATFGGGCCFWIGFTDEAEEGVWVWTSGAPVTYTNWNPGEPNNYWGGIEHHAHFNWLWAGGWNDYPSAWGQHHGIIEYAGAPIPEPSTWLLLGAGLAALGLIRRRPTG